MPSLIQRALLIATTAHLGQVDKNGAPYIEHPVRVSELVTTDDAKAVALLHDTIEDTEVTAESLRNAQVPEHVIEAVVLLTRSVHVPSEEYYRKIKTNPLALEVKLADISDNTSPERTQYLDEKTRLRLQKKYTHALSILKD